MGYKMLPLKIWQACSNNIYTTGLEFCFYLVQGTLGKFKKKKSLHGPINLFLNLSQLNSQLVTLEFRKQNSFLMKPEAT